MCICITIYNTSRRSKPSSGRNSDPSLASSECMKKQEITILMRRRRGRIVVTLVPLVAFTPEVEDKEKDI